EDSRVRGARADPRVPPAATVRVRAGRRREQRARRGGRDSGRAQVGRHPGGDDDVGDGARPRARRRPVQAHGARAAHRVDAALLQPRLVPGGGAGGRAAGRPGLRGRPASRREHAAHAHQRGSGQEREALVRRQPRRRLRARLLPAGPRRDERPL
ncbi:MAG: hypothetical protein AVDCRST_MAG38-179, partial [uncultured Solirubrobacteraceae bacterium]